MFIRLIIDSFTHLRIAVFTCLFIHSFVHIFDTCLLQGQVHAVLSSSLQGIPSDPSYLHEWWPATIPGVGHCWITCVTLCCLELILQSAD